MIFSHIHAQGLVDFAFEESDLAAVEGQRIHSTLALNDNPLLEDYDVKFYGLDVRVNNQSDRIAGSTTILLETKTNSFETLVLELYQTLQVDQILVEGEEVNFTHDGQELYIVLDNPLDSGSLVSTQVFYGGQTGSGMVSERDDDWGVPVTFTLSEPFYAKDWFPCKENLGDKADSVHVFITTDYELMGVSQGIHTATTYLPMDRYDTNGNPTTPLPFI
jgi:hypothetical protein